MVLSQLMLHPEQKHCTMRYNQYNLACICIYPSINYDGHHDDFNQSSQSSLSYFIILYIL